MDRITRGFTNVTAVLAVFAAPAAAYGQDARGERFYYPGSFNWTFLETSPSAARVFNAFDYGHAVLSEVLWTTADPLSAQARLDEEYAFLTEDLLRRPPRFAVAEEAVAPAYVRAVWRAQAMFHWAHVLHRQLYDVYADDRLSDAEKQSLGERLTDYYLSSPLAFTAAPKSMALMDEQYYSQTFRRAYATFNGLIWAYHWLQVGLYEPLVAAGSTPDGRAKVGEAVAHFFDMVDGRAAYPATMPMTPAVAPEFTKRHPRAAAIFDNLHMMHDIISDVLVSPDVPRERKRAVIYEALAEFQDPTRNVETIEVWLSLGLEGHDHGHGGHHE